jgi:hypothetical protein
MLSRPYRYYWNTVPWQIEPNWAPIIRIVGIQFDIFRSLSPSTCSSSTNLLSRLFLCLSPRNFILARPIFCSGTSWAQLSRIRTPFLLQKATSYKPSALVAVCYLFFASDLSTPFHTRCSLFNHHKSCQLVFLSLVGKVVSSMSYDYRQQLLIPLIIRFFTARTSRIRRPSDFLV